MTSHNDFSFINNMHRQSLPPDQQYAIKQSIDTMAPEHSEALFAALSTLSAGEVSLVCHEVLGDMRRLQLHPQHEQLRPHWVFAVCRQALSTINLVDVYNSYANGDITEYALWLQLDAVAGRAVMNEVSESRHQARSDMIAVVRLVKSLSVPIREMPASCRDTVCMASCRLPFLETELQLFSEAVASFRLCVSTESALTPFLPVPYQIAMCMAMGDVMLSMACDAHMKSEASEDAQLLIDNAHAVLMNAKRLLCSDTSSSLRQGGDEAEETRESKRSSGKGHRDALDTAGSIVTLHPLSVQWLLPVTSSDPDRLVEDICSGRLAVSLAACTMKAGVVGQKHMPYEVLSCLEWGIALNTEPSLELLWNLGLQYVCVGQKLEEGADLMSQCIAMSPALSKGHDASAVNGGGAVSVAGTVANKLGTDVLPQRHIVLEWLGMGPQPGRGNKDLCATATSHVYLTHLGDPESAIKAAFWGLQCNGAVGKSVITAINRYVAPVVQAKPKSKPQAQGETKKPSGTNPERGLQRQRSLRMKLTIDPNAEHIDNNLDSTRHYYGNGVEPRMSGMFDFPISEPFERSTSTRSVDISKNSHSGVFTLVLLIVRSYATWARNNTLLPFVDPSHGDSMRTTALRLCSFLLSDAFAAAHHATDFAGPTKARGRPNPSPEDLGRLMLEMAVLLAETGEISEATNICKNYLLSAEQHHDLDNVPVLHILAFLLTCTKGDEQVVSMAMSVCTSALETAEQALAAQSRPDYIPRSVHGFHTCRLISFLDIANLQLSLARIKWSVGGKEQAIRLTDEMVSKLIQSLPHAVPSGGSSSSGGVGVSDYLEKSSFQELSLRVKILTGASQLYRLVENCELAQHCVEEAWRALYSFHPSRAPSRARPAGEATAFMRGRVGGVAALLETTPLTRPDHLLGFGSEEAIGTKEEARALALSDAVWMNMLRAVPTVAGWRLTEGTGWGAFEPCHLEAEVLSECAEIAFAGGQAAVALDLLSLAMSVSPSHSRSMLCIANIELNLLEESCQEGKEETKNKTGITAAPAPTSDSSQLPVGLQRAYHYSQMAADERKLSSHAWCVIAE
jgi:hypothetical protein